MDGVLKLLYFSKRSLGLGVSFATLRANASGAVECQQVNLRAGIRMSDANNLHAECDIAYHRPEGKVSFNEALRLVTTFLADCRDSGVKLALVNARGLTGFPVPSTFERYCLGVEVAANGTGVRVAIVTYQEMIDPERFGITVALNRGALTDVFTAEEDAAAWLRRSNCINHPSMPT
jgi:hypothetical protein